MKQINFDKLNERNEFSLTNFLGVIEMEFIKHGNNYLIKNSNGRIVSEEEKLKLENEELILKDINSCECQKETTKKIAKNKMRIKEIKKDNVKINVDLQPIDSKRVAKHIKEIMQEEKEFTPVETYDEQTALQQKEKADDTIKETDTTI